MPSLTTITVLYCGRASLRVCHLLHQGFVSSFSRLQFRPCPSGKLDRTALTLLLQYVMLLPAHIYRPWSQNLPPMLRNTALHVFGILRGTELVCCSPLSAEKLYMDELGRRAHWNSKDPFESTLPSNPSDESSLASQNSAAVVGFRHTPMEVSTLSWTCLRSHYQYLSCGFMPNNLELSHTY